MFVLSKCLHNQKYNDKDENASYFFWKIVLYKLAASLMSLLLLHDNEYLIEKKNCIFEL